MAGTVYVLDNYYLAITLLITIAYQLFFFSIAFYFKFDKLTDFALLAILTLALSGHPSTRQVVASLFITVWALRLSGFLLFRIIKTGKDDRFDDKRDRFFPFLGFWVFQMVWVWTVSLLVTVLNSPDVRRYPEAPFGTGRDVAGVVLFAIGFVVESASDVQKFVFRARNDKGAVGDKGFFAYSHHPNYFGDIITQFSIYMICVSAAADGYVGGQAFKALYATIVGPFFLTILLMFVSGLPLSEQPGAKKRYEKGLNWEGYQHYLNRTSILIPFPPQIYGRLPTLIKRTVFLELPMYVFDPAKHSDVAREPGVAEDDRDGAPAAATRQSGEPLTGKS
ncbi:Uu.00g033380.m01.CDS01 [Anthostomella pinea]|uniref:Uu.00g033380.m01.CDS01 n=1 Tax=Anthostomella pinea TaxID=933095 RepID=A0AAI8V9V1_9PEZI|nr:Uu.00g033380.m01.CDS01 [Anthostomella pinea]